MYTLSQTYFVLRNNLKTKIVNDFKSAFTQNYRKTSSSVLNGQKFNCERLSSKLICCHKNLEKHISNNNLKIIKNFNSYIPKRKMSTEIKNETSSSETKVLSTKEKLKKAVTEYGSTVIVFHITISLISLGTFYTLVSSGVDVISILDWIGINTSKFVAGTSTFVLSYAIHKVFAPVRISITLGATPIIVRYLRNKKLIK